MRSKHDFQHEEKSVEAFGRRVTYFDFGSGQITLVFLHGITADKRQLLWMAEPLSDSFRCILPDLPGHGGVSLEGVENLSDFGRYVAEFVGVSGLKDVVLVGYSFGGMIVLQMGKMYPDESWFRGIVAWAAPVLGVKGIGKRGSLLLNSAKYLPAFAYPLVVHPIPVWVMGKLGGMPLSDDEMNSLMNLRKKPARLIAPMLKDKIEDLGFTTRCLYVYGTEDIFALKENIDYVKRNKGKNSEIQVIEKGGHFGTKEGRGKVVELVREFAESVKNEDGERA